MENGGIIVAMQRGGFSEVKVPAMFKQKSNQLLRCENEKFRGKANNFH